MNYENKNEPEIKDLIQTIKKTRYDIDKIYNEYFGSIFRNGYYESTFYTQVNNFAFFHELIS